MANSLEAPGAVILHAQILKDERNGIHHLIYINMLLIII